MGLSKMAVVKVCCERQQYELATADNSDVVEDILLLLIHAAHAILEDHRQFVGEGRIIGTAVGLSLIHI